MSDPVITPDPVITIVEERAKSFLLSRTLWANAVAGLAVFLGRHHLPISPDDQVQLVGGVLVVMNIVLRWLTTRPITLMLPGKSAPVASAPAASPPAASVALPPNASFKVTILLVFAVSISALWACANQTPAQQLYEINAGYSAALAAADAYTVLPTCGAGVSKLCKQTSVVTQLQKASDAANWSIDTVTKVAAANGDQAKALAAAAGAMAAFQAVVAGVGTQAAPAQ